MKIIVCTVMVYTMVVCSLFAQYSHNYYVDGYEISIEGLASSTKIEANEWRAAELQTIGSISLYGIFDDSQRPITRENMTQEDIKVFNLVMSIINNNCEYPISYKDFFVATVKRDGTYGWLYAMRVNAQDMCDFFGFFTRM